MTRDEFEATLKQARKFGGYGLDPFFESLLAHDDEQRHVIEGLSAKVKNLTAWSDRMFGTPCAEIRHQQQVEMLEEKIKQQAQQIATLKSELSQRTNLEGSAPCWNSAHMKQIATLREALKELYALVQGECPSLLNEDSGGDAELDLKIEQALKEHKP